MSFLRGEFWKCKSSNLGNVLWNLIFVIWESSFENVIFKIYFSREHFVNVFKKRFLRKLKKTEKKLKNEIRRITTFFK